MTRKPAPTSAPLDLDSLRAGDVLLLGVFAEENAERKCSDLISCMNALGSLAFPTRFEGVAPEWACHAAIYAGDGVLLHSTGPGLEPLFHLVAEDARTYLAGHPRLATVYRCDDAALAHDAARLARRLAEGAHNEQRFSSPGLLLGLLFQALFLGRHGEAHTKGFREAADGRLSALPGVLSCAAYVSASFRAAAELRGDTSAVDGLAADLSPYDLMLALEKHPRWSVLTRSVPRALHSTARPVHSASSAGPRRGPSAWRSALLVPVALLTLALLVAVFTAGFGRSLQRLLLGLGRAPARRAARNQAAAPVLRAAGEAA